MAVLDRVKKWFSSDKDAVEAENARGVGSGVEDTDDYNENYMTYQGDISGYEKLSKSLRLEKSLMRRYADYERMDEYPEITAALDIYADDTTIPDVTRGKTIWATSTDKLLRDVVGDLLHRRLRVEEDIWSNSRTTCKYGNNFAEVLVTDIGVVGLNYLPVPTVRRIEDRKGNLLGFIQDPTGRFDLNREKLEKLLKTRPKDPVDGIVVFAPWEVVHWRLQSKRMLSKYGYSVLDAARYIWKRVQMMEDSALVYKLTRSAARYAHYIYTGDLPPKQAFAMVEKVRRRYQKKKFLNTSSNEQEFRYNPLNNQEDFWIPMGNGKESARIDVISGPDHQVMDDVEYFRDKLISSLKVPKSYMGLGGETNRSTLSAEDVRFARTGMRIQRELRNGYRHIARVHLAALNIDPDTVDWELRMTVPSSIFELAQIEIQAARAELAGQLENWYPREVILKTVFQMSDDDSAYMTKEKIREQQDRIKLDAETQAEIMRLYPELAQMGIMPGMGPEPGDEGQQRAESKGYKDDGTTITLGVLKEAIEAATHKMDKRTERIETALRSQGAGRN